MAVICTFCGGAHPRWECKQTALINEISAKMSAPGKTVAEKLKSVGIVKVGKVPYDRNAAHKTYMRDYMRKKRAKDKEKLK